MTNRIQRSHVMARGRATHCDGARNGFVLAVVTIAIVLLSLAAYNYSSTMLLEHEASAMGGRDVVARTAAESAIEFAAVRIAEQKSNNTINLHHDPEVFRGRLLMDSSVDRGRVRWSVVSVNETSDRQGGIRFGLVSETAKFNVNGLLKLEAMGKAMPDEAGINLVHLSLSNIPNMTDSVIDSILDWLDEDEDPRAGGAESAYYESLPIAYSSQNGPMESTDELLKVQGVTPALFYGEDTNRNGLLDDGEDRNDDGILNPGWQDYLTAESREKNKTPGGKEKINLNMTEMTKLYDAIEVEFGKDAASFVVAYRLGGTEYAQATPSGGTDAGVQGKISRNDIDLTKTPKYAFTSVFELIGGETKPVKMTTGKDQAFGSPWPEDNNTLLSVCPMLESLLTTTEDAFQEGRININQARREVLFAIPQMPEDVPDAIMSARPQIIIDVASTGVMAQRTTAAWLVAEGLTDLDTLRKIGPHVTTAGDIYRFQAVGHFDAGGPTTRLEAVIDATELPPKVRFVRDLTSLGRGYHPGLLTPLVR